MQDDARTLTRAACTLLAPKFPPKDMPTDWLATVADDIPATYHLASLRALVSEGWAFSFTMAFSGLRGRTSRD